jgi:hypothetical protein
MGSGPCELDLRTRVRIRVWLILWLLLLFRKSFFLFLTTWPPSSYFDAHESYFGAATSIAQAPKRSVIRKISQARSLCSRPGNSNMPVVSEAQAVSSQWETAARPQATDAASPREGESQHRPQHSQQAAASAHPQAGSDRTPPHLWEGLNQLTN